MESTVPSSSAATASVIPTSLLAAFATIPDPRRTASIAYPLPALLGLAVAAILCAHTSVLAIAEWGSRQSADLLAQLGFPDACTPHQSTLQRLFAKLDVPSLAHALHETFDCSRERTRGQEGVAIDGKAQRGRHAFPDAVGVVDALVAFCHEQRLILAEAEIGQGADKAEAELTVAPRVITALDWYGRVLTGDALYCQRQLCRQVVDADGDYVLTVRANQQKLYQHFLHVFDPQARPLLDRRHVWTIEKGHGRIDRREIVVTADPVALPDWPGVAQLFMVTRIWWIKGKRKEQVRYGITSLPPAIGTPRRLLALRRGHWSIENQSHRVKDVSFAEDASLIHVGNGPSICSLLRGAALNLLRHAGTAAITSRLRYFSQHPDEAVTLLILPLVTHA